MNLRQFVAKDGETYCINIDKITYLKETDRETTVKLSCGEEIASAMPLDKFLILIDYAPNQ